MKRISFKNKAYIGTIYTKQGMVIWLYTNYQDTRYWAVYYPTREDKQPTEIFTTRSWKKLMRKLQEDLRTLGIKDSTKALWIDRWLWTNKPLHEYIMDY